MPLSSGGVDSRYRRQHIVVFLLISLRWTVSVNGRSLQRQVSAAMQSRHSEGGTLPSSLLPRASLRVVGEGADDTAAAAPPSKICKLYLAAGSLTAPQSIAIGEAWLPWHHAGSTLSTAGGDSSSSALAPGGGNTKAMPAPDGSGDGSSSRMLRAAHRASPAQQQRSCAPRAMILPSSTTEGLAAPAERETLTGAVIAAVECMPFKWLAPSEVCTLLTQPPTAVIIVGDSVSRHLFLGLQVRGSGASCQQRC